MSYSIYLFKAGTKVKYQSYKGEDFFENNTNLEPFTQEMMNKIKERLGRYNYRYINKTQYGEVFGYEDFGEVLLSNHGLYFTAGTNSDSIFEIEMTASEFTDTGELEKYNPQTDEWEE